MADIAVSSALALLEIVSSFLQDEINLKNVRSDIARIRNWLDTMQAFLLDGEGEQRKAVFRDEQKQIRAFAYDIEDILDKFMFHVPHHFHRHLVSQVAHDGLYYFKQRSALKELSSEIQNIRKKLDDYITVAPLRMPRIPVEASNSETMYLNYSPYWNAEEDEIVGLKWHMEEILNQLLSDEPWITVAIVGPAGSGKTVLATKVFQDPRVRAAFKFLFWVKVSHNFELEDIKRSIEQQLPGQAENISAPYYGSSVGGKEKLMSLCWNHRYIIVLDDVWSRHHWNRILNELTIKSRGSRIILTSCNHEVASCFVNAPRYLHKLDGLSWKDARNLFCKNAFRSNGGECPPALEEWAEKIVKKCEGLPLALKTVGSLLSNRSQMPVAWKKVHDSIGTDLDITRSLLPGYNDLRTRPDLKSCFFYLGIFPQDYSIQREILIRLWITEGFVKEKKNRSLEDGAWENLNALVDRNLVSVSKRDVNGRIRSIRVLNFVREFIISKAEEESFFWVFTGERSAIGKSARRLSLIADLPNDFQFQNENLSKARSAFFFRESNFDSFLRPLNLLRVLDMKNAHIDSFPVVILGLLLLRYLSLQRTRIPKIPNSIKKLSLLETLDLKKTLITKLPNDIFRLHHLCNLLVSHYDSHKGATVKEEKGVEIGDGVGDLTNIEKLSLIKVNSNIVEELGKLVHVKKLGIMGLKQKHGKKFCEALQKMHDLSVLDVRSEGMDVLDSENIPEKPVFEFLQRLYLKGRLSKLPIWVSSLHSLIKIHLEWSRMDASPLEALQDLPNLLELQMVDSYTGDCLEFRAGTFGKLRLLVIEQFCQLKAILVLERAMPQLHTLKIIKCESMRILPIGIECLSCLEELILHGVNEELKNKVRHEEPLAIQHIKVIKT